MDFQSVSIKGKKRAVPALFIGQQAIIISRIAFCKLGRIHDEFWLEYKDIPNPVEIINGLKQSKNAPDLFTFAQKIPDTAPKYPYHIEWENLAVVHFESHSHWFENQVDRMVRKSIRKSIREGVVTKTVQFTDDLVNGISSIYNETPTRQGKKFWHYGKPLSAVKNENSTYLDRSIFIGAFYEGELIGFLKIVFCDQIASIMQILSKKSYFYKRPTNALLSKAVEICESRNIRYLTYGQYSWENKEKSTLADFKRNNGFERVNIPRYYVPLNSKGVIALRLRLHKGLGIWVPGSFKNAALGLRSTWYKYYNK
jgi:hypothetical protein